jgi:hypothetical protein
MQKGKLRSGRGKIPHLPVGGLGRARCSIFLPDDEAAETARFRGSTDTRDRFNSEAASGPFFSSHRSFPLLLLGEAEHAFPHIASLHTNAEKFIPLGLYFGSLGTAGACVRLEEGDAGCSMRGRHPSTVVSRLRAKLLHGQLNFRPFASPESTSNLQFCPRPVNLLHPLCTTVVRFCILYYFLSFRLA